jgi:hypothetical protein
MVTEFFDCSVCTFSTYTAILTATLSGYFLLGNRKCPDSKYAVGTFPIAQHEMSRQCFLLSGHFLLSKIVSGYFLLPNRKYHDSLFLCRNISCCAILSGYFLLAQCRDISYWVCRDKYVPPNF